MLQGSEKEVIPLLDTIAQPVLSYRGDLKTLIQRANNQYFSKKLAEQLLRIPNTPLKKGYKRTFFDCNKYLIQTGKKLTAKYCNARWCNVCNRARTGKLWNSYKTQLEAFLEPQLVTLTIPNVSETELPNSLKMLIREFALIIKKGRKTRTINGIRKLECTYNADEDTYHPHIHVYIDGKVNAQYLMDEWLRRFETAEPWCQDSRDAYDLRELFKYTTKIVTKSKRDGTMGIYVNALDKIFRAMYAMRTFQSFGKVRMISEDIDDIRSQEYNIPEYDHVQWNWHEDDWKYFGVTSNGFDCVPLTNYKPSEAMKELTTTKMIQ